VAPHLSIVVLCPDDRDVGDRAARDPCLRTIEDEAIASPASARRHAAGIGAVVWLGKAKATDLLARRELGQPGASMLLTPERVDGVHYERALYGHKTAQPAVAALELLCDEAVRHVVHPRTPVLDREV